MTSKTPISLTAFALASLASTAAAQTAPPQPLAPPTAPSPLLDAGAESEDGNDTGVVLNASFFSRYELRENYTQVGLPGGRIGEGDGVAYRARVSLASKPVDIGNSRYVSVSFTPQAVGFWGEISGGLSDPELAVHEAKLRVGWQDSWVDVGRFEMIYGEHLVIGNVDWNENGRAFDGARLHVGMDNGAYIDAFATQIAEGTRVGATEPFGSGDTYFTGVYAGAGPALADNLELDAYGLVLIDPEVTEGPMEMLDGDSAAEVTVGSRVKYKLGRVALRAEGGVQFGERITTDTTLFAWQLDADATVKVSDAVKATLGGQWATGDDPETMDRFEGWNQLFPTAHKFLGLADVIGGRTNASSVYAKARWTPVPELVFAGDQHVFFRPERADGVDAFTGVETDLWGLWKIGKGVGLRSQYSLFVADENGPLGVNQAVHYVEIQLRLDM